MLKNILKIFGKSIKKTTETIGKSMEFIDDTLEKEHIINAAEKSKELTGSIVSKAGETYQKAVNKIDAISKTETVSQIIDNVKEAAGEATHKAAELYETGKEKLESNEHLNKAMDKISETGREIASKVEKQAANLNKQIEDSVFGEEE